VTPGEIVAFDAGHRHGMRLLASISAVFGVTGLLAGLALRPVIDVFASHLTH
jgi:hypothetical protein